MTLIAISGPEKAGKSTLAAALAKDYGAEVIHWGPVHSHLQYVAPLMDATADPGRLVVWDRSWLCGYAYHQLVGSNPWAVDPWEGQWLFGRALQTAGLGVVLLGPPPDSLAGRRDETDIPIDPRLEQEEFRRLGTLLKWRVIDGQTTPSITAECVLQETAKQAQIARVYDIHPTEYCGPLGAKVVFVGEAPGGYYPGGWLPWSSRYTMKYGRLLGYNAFSCGWTNVSSAREEFFQGAKLLVACGDAAARYCERLSFSNSHDPHPYILHIPHPAWLYRWGRVKEDIPFIENTIQTAVGRVLHTSIITPISAESLVGGN